MADEDEEFPLATAFNEAITKHTPDGKVSLDEILHASASIASAYLDQMEDGEEKNAEVECFVTSVRESVYPDGQPELCMGCAISDAFNRKFPAGRTKESDKEMLDVLSQMSAQFLEGASERGLKTFFDLIRSHRAARDSEGPMPSHLTH
jgi:hypothetical protein